MKTKFKKNSLWTKTATKKYHKQNLKIKNKK